MELTYDWSTFQSVFYPQRRMTGLQGSQTPTPIYLVVEGNIALAVFAESEDLSDWVGKTTDEIANEFSHREIVRFERAKVDEWIQSSLSLPHFYDQIGFLREQSETVLPMSGRKGDLKKAVETHFLFEALETWWSRVLPSSYGIFIRLEGAPDRELIAIFRRGRLDTFHSPDLASMGADRRKRHADVVKYLSEKYLIPVQGLFVPAEIWYFWTKSPYPWKEIAKSVRSNRARMVPFRWGTAMLLFSKAYLGL